MKKKQGIMNFFHRDEIINNDVDDIKAIEILIRLYCFQENIKGKIKNYDKYKESYLEIIVNKDFIDEYTKLLDYELTENKIKLNFNQPLLDTFYNDSLLEEVKYAISNSIKDTYNVKNVIITVNNKEI
jgi:hypothetical protein